MSNPLSQIGQPVRPDINSQSQQQGSQDAGQAQRQAPPEGQQENPQPGAGTGSWNPPATRLPQHPQQQQEDPAERPGEQQRIRQQGETHPEDTSLPAPTEVD